MNKEKLFNISLGGGLVLAIVAIVFGIIQFWPQNFGGHSTTASRSCVVNTVSSVIVGAAEQTHTILAAHGQRAWARVQMNNNATTTVFLSFDEGAAATTNNGIGLNQTNTNGATSTPYIDFGLNTDFPYTGAVTGKTTVGTTTVQVTECRYSL